VLTARDVPFQAVEDQQLLAVPLPDRHDVPVLRRDAVGGERLVAVIRDDDPVQPSGHGPHRLVVDPVHRVVAVLAVEMVVPGEPDVPAAPDTGRIGAGARHRGASPARHQPAGPGGTRAEQEATPGRLG
jgi:hypothetical protein